MPCSPSCLRRRSIVPSVSARSCIPQVTAAPPTACSSRDRSSSTFWREEHSTNLSNHFRRPKPLDCARSRQTCSQCRVCCESSAASRPRMLWLHPPPSSNSNAAGRTASHARRSPSCTCSLTARSSYEQTDGWGSCQRRRWRARTRNSHSSGTTRIETKHTNLQNR